MFNNPIFRKRFLLTILIVVACYWLWFGLTQRSFVEDDIGSIYAAQGILKYGIPQLPSGYLNDRGYIPAYLLALSMWIFGTNTFSVIFFSLVCGLGSLWLIYRIAADILRRPNIGLAAVVILPLLQLQTQYATSPRMYVFVEFFTLATIYTAWLGFIKGISIHRYLSLGAFLAAIMSQRIAGVLLVSLPVAISVAWSLEEENTQLKKRFIIIFRRFRGYLLEPPMLFVLFLLASGLCFMYLYLPHGAVPRISSHSGLLIKYTGFNLDPKIWWLHAGYLELAAPGFFFGFLAFLVFGWRHYKQCSEFEKQGLTFLFVTLMMSLIVFELIVIQPGTRLWLFLIPLYTLFAFLGVQMIIQYRFLKKVWISYISFFTFAMLYGLTHHIAIHKLPIVGSFHYPKGIGTPCQNTKCDIEFQHFHEKIREKIALDDIIVSSNPNVTGYYLGRIDFFLRQKKDFQHRFREFDVSADEYLGIPFMDSVEKLQGLLGKGQKVWIFVDIKAKYCVSKELMDAIIRSCKLEYRANRVPLVVFTNQ